MKGQTAVEYLMTYGWAILIILIVAGVLAYYGIFAPASFLGTSARGFTTIQVLQPWSLNTVGNFTANLENRVGSDVNVTAIYIWSETESGKSGTQTLTDEESFVAGQKKIVAFPAIGAVGGTAGNTFSYSVSIQYRYADTFFNSTGAISGTFS